MHLVGFYECFNQRSPLELLVWGRPLKGAINRNRVLIALVPFASALALSIPTGRTGGFISIQTRTTLFGFFLSVKAGLSFLSIHLTALLLHPRRKAFLRSFIKRIEIGEDKATIYYHSPLQYNENRKVTAKVLPIVTPGGPKGYFAKPQIETFFELTVGTRNA